jgi:zinc protease
MKRKIIILICLLFLSAAAQGGGITMPPATQETLPNGLELVIIENHELPLVYMKLFVMAGSIRDPEGREGLASFTANMLKKGTASRSAKQIAEEIAYVGGDIDVSSNRDAMELAAELLTRHLEVGIAIISDMVRNPAFDTSEIERYRKQVLNGIIQSKESPDIVCSENFNRLLFGDHPYGHPAVGTRESVSALERKDMVEFHDEYIRPNNSIFIVSGDVVPAEIISRLEAAFGGWERKEIAALSMTTPISPEGRRILLIDKPDATQSRVMFGSFGITRQSEYYYPFLVMNYILGAGVSFINRLMTEVRNQSGLTYDIRTINDFNVLPGAFYCATSTENDSTLKAIEMALNIMSDVAQKGLTDGELNQAIDFYTGYYPTSLETPRQWAEEMAKVRLYSLPGDYIEEFEKNIGSVKKEDVLKVARYLIDTNDLVFCVVSNAADVKTDLEKLGKVTVVELDEL